MKQKPDSSGLYHDKIHKQGEIQVVKKIYRREDNILVSPEGATVIDVQKAIEANKAQILHFLSFGKRQEDITEDEGVNNETNSI